MSCAQHPLAAPAAPVQHADKVLNFRSGKSERQQIHQLEANVIFDHASIFAWLNVRQMMFCTDIAAIIHRCEAKGFKSLLSLIHWMKLEILRPKSRALHTDFRILNA